MEEVRGEQYPKPNYNLHAFYYPWYGNPETDGQYLHWNHPYIQVRGFTGSPYPKRWA